MFSLTLKEKDPPSVPTPAPALISPVGFSSTTISIIFRSLLEPSLTSCITSPKRFLDLILDIDLSILILLKGSPSSNNNSPLITASSVTVFPLIFILSTNCLFPSKIFILTSIVSSSITSFTECSTN